MLAFSVQSEQYVRFKKRKSRIDKRIDTASRWVFCALVLAFAHLVTDMLLDTAERMGTQQTATTDPFLEQSKTARSKLRGTLTYVDLMEPIQTGSTSAGLVSAEKSPINAGSVPTQALDARPSDGLKFRHPEELADPDLHIR